MNNITETLRQKLATGTATAMVHIIAQAGSTPRTSGARMLVFPDGAILGTIGGGRIEAEAARAARAMLSGLAAEETAESAVLRFSLEGAMDMDMICGGSLTVLVELFLPGAREEADISLAWEYERSDRAYCLLSRLPQKWRDGNARFESVRFLVDEKTKNGADTAGPGRTAPEEVLCAARTAMATKQAPFVLDAGEASWFIAPRVAPSRAFVFGAGHVSIAAAALAAQVGFAVTVVDDRPEFANAERFPGATLVVLPDMKEDAVALFLGSVAPGPDDAVIIVTRGHAYDRDALAASLPTEAGYIGMIGSKSKRDAIYAGLRERGIADALLAAVHSPIGLPIRAETPEEIAVSIVAELIQWRRRDA